MPCPRSLVAALVALAACSRPPPSAEAPAAPSAPAAESAQPRAAAPAPQAEKHEEGPLVVPAACGGTGGGPGGASVCTPDPAFAKRLCAGSYPDVALALFRKESPFTRGYVTRDTDAWNASGGASARVKLELDEEVVLVAHRAPPKNGMVVSGASGGFDVVRWDGTCVSLDALEVTLRRPPRARTPAIPWRYLDDKTQDALLGSDKVKAAYGARQRECKGATMGEVSLKCVKADAALSSSIVDYVRAGGRVPSAP